MGTGSLTKFITADRQEICTIYKQLDGYPSGWGADLAEFLLSRQLVNGISVRGTTGKQPVQANGFECLVAQLIAEFKDGPGGIYVYPANQLNLGEDYVYRIYEPQQLDMSLVQLDVSSHNVTIFHGSLSKYTEFIRTQAAAA